MNTIHLTHTCLPTTDSTRIDKTRKDLLAKILYVVCPFILKAYAILFRRTYKVRGLEHLPKGAKIIALNHTVGCDPLSMPFILDEKVHFLLQAGYFSTPILGWMLKKMEQVPVYRGTDRAKDALTQTCELLRAGKTIVIFPEGKEVPFGKRIPGKTGVIRMALETGAPIIPLGMYVPRESLSKVHFTWKGKKCSGLWQVTGKRHLHFSSPWYPNLSTTETDPLDIRAETQSLMDHIYAQVEEARKEARCESLILHNLIHQW